MAYVKTIWKDSPDETTPLNSANLNKIENGIATLDAEKTTALLATNLVTNGDFSNGTTGWSSSVATITNVGNELNLLATETGGRVFQLVTMLANIYYLRAKVKSTSALVGISNQTGTIIKAHSGNGSYESLSAIYTQTNVGAVNVQLVRDNRTSGWDTVYIDDVLLTNLTQIFGAGNEPTKEQMDWLLAQRFTNSWFDGTKELATAKDILNLVHLKASKTQEAWIIPTLVNSWVERSPYTVSYFKDQFGMVILRGMVKDGVVGQWAFILPVGYRPSIDQVFIVNGGSFSNSFAKIIITTIGYVYVYISNLEVTLNNVQFRAV